MKRIAVFCGSSLGNDPKFAEQAKRLGKTLANNHVELVYGGANVGLMGIIANAVLNENGKVIGVLPTFLADKEIAHNNLTELLLVETMHERKTKMNDLSDGVIALPGGFGTLEELFEMLTWAQLRIHNKPIGILNINGYYDSLIALINNMVENGLLKEANKKLILVSDNVDELLGEMKNYKAPTETKWMNK